MRPYSFQLSQSKYYSPAFNTAIFDGPLRIYFAQYQEAFALKVYFRLQSRLESWLNPRASAVSRRLQPHVFIMLYPTEEIFANGFSPEQAQERVVAEFFQNDFMIGACCPLQEEDYECILTRVENLISRPSGVLEYKEKKSSDCSPMMGRVSE